VDVSAYVHFPWCLQKCPYCDFASGAIRRDEVQHARYADAVIAELDSRAQALSQHRLVSVFFGGGTPSLWAPAQLGRVLAAIRGAFAPPADGDPELEVTVECNPSSLDRAHAAALRRAGVGRLSIGVQSLDDGRLRFLGRLHSGEGALGALRDALAEVPRVSGDLMFGMPQQRAGDFVDEVQRLLDLGLSHISAYALTIEAQTQFGQLHRKGRLTLAPEGDFAETFLATRARMEAAGMRHYEVSNYAMPGETSRHNQHYWRGGSYLGLGAGAVGMLHGDDGDDGDDSRGRRYRNARSPEAYLATPRAPDVEEFEEHLQPGDLANEALMLGLRTAEGVDVEQVRRRTGLDLVGSRAADVQRQLELGNLVLQGERMRVPQDRWLHLDAIVAQLFA
jgi:oxygen-independent coproporphyrinogen-3 oxidase